MKCVELPENFVVIDVETSGLEPSECGLLEIGATDTAGRMFYRRVALERDRRADWPALVCNGIDPLDLGVGVSIEDALCDLFRWLSGGSKRWILGGKNPQFDYSWLGANWPKGTVGCSLSEVISRRCIDLHSLAYGYGMELGMDMAAETFTTDDIYMQLGMYPEPMPHNALRGVVHEMEGFRRLLVDGVERDCDPIFQGKMDTLDREWAQTVDAPEVVDNRRGARVEPLALARGAASK